MNRSTATVDYIMEDPREATRLERKVDAHAWVQRYLAERVRAGMEVLCVGCGPGSILREIAALDGSIKGTGIDISAERIEEAKRRSPRVLIAWSPVSTKAAASMPAMPRSARATAPAPRSAGRQTSSSPSD